MLIGGAGLGMATIKLLLVDDHGPLRKALREGLEATGVVQVVDEAATGREAVARALELDMDVILMDADPQDPQAGPNTLGGGGAGIAIRRGRPGQPVVFYSIRAAG